MTRLQPSAVARALLRLLSSVDEPLAGDLLEEFHSGRSRLWLWRQLLVGLATRRPPRPVASPLGLAPAEWVPIRRLPDAWTVNLTASPVSGIGGLGIALLGALVTIVEPAAWFLPVSGVTGGVLLGIAMIALHRRRSPLPSTERGPLSLSSDRRHVSS